MQRFFSRIIAGILGLLLAVWFVPGIQVKVFSDSNFFGIPLTTTWHVIILLGIILGVLNTFIKPILNAITLPLRIVTLGLFGLVINIAMIWAIDLIFQEITIPFLWPILWTTIIVWGLNILLPGILRKKHKSLEQN